MTYEAARPRYTLDLAGKGYELTGSFELIEAVEYALKDGIGDIVVRTVNGMPTHDLVKLVSTVLTACGHKMTAREVAGVLWGEIGLTGEANDLLRLHLYSFLRICICRPTDREETAKRMGEIMGKLTDASPGDTTSDSA